MWFDVRTKWAEMFSEFSENSDGSGSLPFMTNKLAMYAPGHFAAALPAWRPRHRISPARGVPHSDRLAMLSTYLVARASWRQAGSITSLNCLFAAICERSAAFHIGAAPPSTWTLLRQWTSISRVVSQRPPRNLSRRSSE